MDAISLKFGKIKVFQEIIVGFPSALIQRQIIIAEGQYKSLWGTDKLFFGEMLPVYVVSNIKKTPFTKKTNCSSFIKSQ